jgi:hypothetical protein
LGDALLSCRPGQGIPTSTLGNVAHDAPCGIAESCEILA